MAEALGSLRHRRAATQIAALGREDRKALTNSGLRIGRESIYYQSLLRPEAMALRAVLWSVHAGSAPVTGLRLGRPSLPYRTGMSEAFFEAVGYRVLGGRPVRVDIVEHVTARAARCARQRTLVPAAELAGLLGCPTEELMPAMASLGFRLEPTDEGMRILVAPRARGPSRRAQRYANENRETHSPFAALRQLHSAR